MRKILAPADKALAEIGRFVLVRPLLSAFLLLIAIVFALINNGVFKTTTDPQLIRQSIAIPQPLPSLESPAIAGMRMSSFMVNSAHPMTISSPLANTTVTAVPSSAAEKPVVKSNSVADTESTLTYVGGEVHKSLYKDARKAGLSTKQANQLTHLFDGKIIRPGDQFSVLLPNVGANNKKASDALLMAQLTQDNKVYQLIRFTDPKGHADYYLPTGESLHPELSRAPLHYTRISSYFSSSRYHPILHFFRPHLGVDYAAPAGTPIKAAGNGVIAEESWAGGYGRSILIKHDGNYSTLYAHMSGFASNLHVGSTVTQGQVIGYVGSTGLATGPHLHFEIHVNNVAMNPLTVKLPGAPIPKAYRTQFLAQSRMLLAQLKSDQAIRLADKGDTTKRT